MGHISLLDALDWACKLRKNKINQFEYKDLPDGLKDLKLLRRAKEEGLIRKLEKNGNGRITWRLTDNLKCKDEKINNIVDIDCINLQENEDVVGGSIDKGD